MTTRILTTKAPLFRPLRASSLRTYIKPTPTSKRQEFFIAASFPDDFEAPVVSEKRGVATPSWDEIHATMSEAMVKADRGDVQFRMASSREELERLLQPDRMDPKMDEM
ncbi:hypothetical protein BDV25DRAFT_148938 [Aspergillus avenaceus]|uniref:Uncharacterized protein n=1 Tax=Aspergillus avenaceus TaxID=36643 RepID=A0A5N6U520_ASPAV|nr:hypothetical protein BDV25DRAFT_148938 [Aspergillus avenaceus]